MTNKIMRERWEAGREARRARAAAEWGSPVPPPPKTAQRLQRRPTTHKIKTNRHHGGHK